MDYNPFNMNYQINIHEMKKKTEIEDKLLFDINNNFQEYINDIEYIKKNFIQIDNIINSEKYFNINIFNQLNKQNQQIQVKLFEHPNTIYSIFQYFYLKRKNYMGMNLTGLIQGKMETGLGFRTSINKMSLKSIKDIELKNIIEHYFLNTYTDMENINIYKINAKTFAWSNYTSNTYKFIYLIANLTTQKFFFIFEKN